MNNIESKIKANPELLDNPELNLLWSKYNKALNNLERGLFNYNFNNKKQG